MPQILKGSLSSELDKIWAQIRRGAFDCYLNNSLIRLQASSRTLPSLEFLFYNITELFIFLLRKQTFVLIMKIERVIGEMISLQK